MASDCTSYQLKCNECGKLYGNQPLSACEDCLAPLEVVYDLESARDRFTRSAIRITSHPESRFSGSLPRVRLAPGPFLRPLNTLMTDPLCDAG